MAKPGDGAQTISVSVIHKGIINNSANISATRTLSTSCTGSQLSSHRKWNAISDLQCVRAKHKTASNLIHKEQCDESGSDTYGEWQSEKRENNQCCSLDCFICPNDVMEFA